MIKVYYDGKCSLCLKEIKYYQSKISGKKVSWFDITDAQTANELRFSQRDALLYFHVIDNDDNVLVGIDSFICLWQQIEHPRIFKLLARFTNFPVVHKFARLIYYIFARLRFHFYDHCRLSN